MSHSLPSQPSRFEELSQEEQIEYVETHLDELVAQLRANPMLEPWEVELLADRLSRYRSQVEGGIPWEEFEKEFMKD
ncbi:MAG TPA: addiction module protein [Pyrinomonadaceae bacterium]|nr:addiction module protein [Pyrinomonadaceae bacterium]